MASTRQSVACASTPASDRDDGAHRRDRPAFFADSSLARELHWRKAKTAEGLRHVITKKLDQVGGFGSPTAQ